MRHFKLTLGKISWLVVTLVFSFATLTLGQTRSSEREGKSTEQPTVAENPAQPPKNEDPLFKGMKYRVIGPFRGGRSLTASGIPGDPTTYYFGATGGGVWKTTDGAVSWTSVFDKQAVSAIGSLAVAPSDPNIVYVGTGEACIRGNISHGDGIYKTVDGGKTWRNIGLRDSRAIGKLIVDPKNPDIVFVAALGHPFGPNSERGIFRTTDGGKNWEKVLYKDENTGGIDITFDPHNSHILFRLLVGGSAHALESFQRRTRERSLSLQRRRNNLEKTRRTRIAQGSIRPNRRRRRGQFRPGLRPYRSPGRGPLPLR